MPAYAILVWSRDQLRCVADRNESDHIMGNIHHKYLKRATSAMAEDYVEIRDKLSGNPKKIQESGHKTEELWATLLKKWLPPSYKVVTRKYIVSEVLDDENLKETDLIVLNPSYPPALSDDSYVMASGVAAAFSIKLTLGKAELEEAAQESAVLAGKRSVPYRKPYETLVSPFPFGVLSPSHCWKSPGSTPKQNVLDHLVNHDLAHAAHPSQSIDLVCVADLGTWKHFTHFDAAYDPLPGHEEMGARDAAVETGFFETLGPSDTPPIASFLGALYSRLGIPDPTMRAIAEGFNSADNDRWTGDLRRWPVKDLFSLNEARYFDDKQSFLIK